MEPNRTMATTRNDSTDVPNDPSEIEVKHAIMGEKLDFEGERDQGTESWRRADGLSALISRESRAGWLVTLSDGHDTHIVAIVVKGDDWFGRCDCRGYQYHDGPCAHLCTLRKAAFIGAKTNDGETVVPLNVATSRTGSNLETDGGHNIHRDEPGTIYGRRCGVGVGSQRAHPHARDRLVIAPQGGATTRCLTPPRPANHDVITRNRRDYISGGRFQ